MFLLRDKAPMLSRCILFVFFLPFSSMSCLPPNLTRRIQVNVSTYQYDLFFYIYPISCFLGIPPPTLSILLTHLTYIVVCYSVFLT